MVLQKNRREEQRTKRPFPQHKHKKKKEKQLLVDRRQVFPLHRHSLHRVPYHNFITVPQSYTGTEVDSLKGLLFLCHVVCVRLGRGRAKPKKGAHHVTGEESKTARSCAFKDNLRCNVESKATPIATCDCCPTPGDSGGGRGPHFCHCRVVMRMADILHRKLRAWLRSLRSCILDTRTLQGSPFRNLAGDGSLLKSEQEDAWKPRDLADVIVHSCRRTGLGGVLSSEHGPGSSSIHQMSLDVQTAILLLPLPFEFLDKYFHSSSTILFL